MNTRRRQRLVINRAFWIGHFIIALILSLLITFALYGASFYALIAFANPIGMWGIIYEIFLCVHVVYLDICDERDQAEREILSRIIDYHS